MTNNAEECEARTVLSGGKRVDGSGLATIQKQASMTRPRPALIALLFPATRMLGCRCSFAVNAPRKASTRGCRTVVDSR